MAARLLAAIERLKKTPWAVLALLLVSAVVALAQFTGAAQKLVELVAPAPPPPPADPRVELARLGITFTPEALAQAATSGDARAAGLLLAAGMTGPAALDPALLNAAAGGHIVVARQLRDAGADPAASLDGSTALATAAGGGRAEMVRLFLEKPLPPAAIEAGFVTAAIGQQVEMLALLGPRLAEPRAAAGSALQAVLGRAVDDPEAAGTLRAILAWRPELAAKDDNGQTPLIAAVTRDMTTAVQVLAATRTGLDVAGQCGSGAADLHGTALHCASVRGTGTALAAVAALLAGGAAVDARGDAARTPLMLAAANGDAAIVRALLKAGADPALRDAQGRSALDLARAARFGDPAATVALLAP